MRRTTVVAPDDDLEVLAHEARHRGISLGRLLGELASHRANELRRERRPRLAAFEADVSIARVEESEPAARPFRS